MTEPAPDGWVSTFVKQGPPVPLIARDYARRLLRLHPDGSVELLPWPTTAELLKHAERYGTECVAESAAEFMGEEGLTALIGRLDVLDRRRGERENAGRRITRSKAKLRPAEVRARALLGIPEEEGS